MEHSCSSSLLVVRPTACKKDHPSPVEASSVSMMWYRRSKPQGKVRRRVQDLRIPSSSYHDFIASEPMLDLSHNESARLAADSLLSQGLDEYHEVLKAEGEVDFLSKLEKIYILENGRDGSTDEPGASEDGGKELQSSAASQSATQCPAMSMDSDPTVADVKRPDCVFVEPSVEVYFQPDCRAARMKDLVREFIRKATTALAIVMDSFSDVELLCDLLEASRRRNVAVHLLLDRLNLNQFVSMWQELKLNSKNFPKLSVRSVDGQTYCAKTGRKLTGQIAETFIITDWTEVLTTPCSFSWLSWQVHRSLAILVKGSAVAPFHQEFNRLNSSSKPVPSFVTYITVPDTVPLHTTLHAAQSITTDVSKVKSSQTKTACNEDAQNSRTKAKIPVVSNPLSPQVAQSKVNTQPPHRAGTGTQTCEKPPQLHPKPVENPKHTAGAACTQTNKPNQNLSVSQRHVPYVQSQLSSLAITTTAEKNVIVQESNPQYTTSPTHGQQRAVRYHSQLKAASNLEHQNVGAEGLFFQQRNRDRLITSSGAAAGQNTQRRQWSCPLNFQPKVDFLSDHPKVLSPSASQQTDRNAGTLFPFTHPGGHESGLQTKVSSLGTKRRDQLQRLHSHPLTEAHGPAPTATGPLLKPQLQSDSKLFFPATGTNLHLQPQASQQLKLPPRLNWMPQSHAARPRPVGRQSSFDTAHGLGQHAGWRPFHTTMNTSLGRSKSMTDRYSAGFKGAGLNYTTYPKT